MTIPTQPGLLAFRDVQPGDLEIFFQFQLDPDANHMAALAQRSRRSPGLRRPLAEDPGGCNDPDRDHSVRWAGGGQRAELPLGGRTGGQLLAGQRVRGRGVATWALGEFLKYDTVAPHACPRRQG